jgi:hypothetical protein
MRNSAPQRITPVKNPPHGASHRFAFEKRVVLVEIETAVKHPADGGK